MRYGEAERVIEPHCHGWLRTGREGLVAYQRAGGSSTGHDQGWKTLLLDKVEVIHAVPTLATEPREDFELASVDFVRVHCSVSA